MIDKIKIELTWADVYDASCVGVERHLESLRRGSVSNVDQELFKDIDTHIAGAIGELAVALALRIDWHRPVNNYTHGGDVAIYQVRTSAHSYAGLGFNKRDKDGEYILVTGDVLNARNLVYTIHGWLSRKESMTTPEYRQAVADSSNLWHVGQNRLHPIATLPRLAEYQQGAPLVIQENSYANLRVPVR